MAARQRFSRLISADSHVYEPRDLWWKALGEKFGDRTPRVLDAYQGREGTFFYTGYQGCPVAWLREHNSRETEAATGRALDPLILTRTLQTPADGQANAGGWVELLNEIQPVLANDFIFGGILDCFPQLKIVCSEFEMSWVPGFTARLDQIEDIAPHLHLPKLEMRASDYMRTRVWHGFINDTAADHSIPYVGASQVLWGSDFPHTRSIGLEAQSSLSQLLGTLAREEQEKVGGGNAAHVLNRD